jgi:ABC-type transport system substrate-binding protein
MMRFLSIIILWVSLLSCGSEEVKKFEHAGGKVTFALDNEPSTYIAREVMDYYSATVLSQVTEGLVGIDPKTIKIIPKIAEKWSISDDGKTYTFTLRNDVYFHKHEVFKSEDDRKLTVDDVVKSIELGCSKDQRGTACSAYSYAFKDNLKGANEYFAGTAKKISGLRTKGNQIILELVNEDHNFLYKLANVNSSIISKRIVEADRETELVGTGPFVYKKENYIKGADSKLILVRNDDYYLKDKDGNALPYLDSLVFIFQSMKLEQLAIFETGKTDLIIGLPTSRITAMLEGRLNDFNSKPPVFELANNPLLETNFYFFNLKDDRFKDPRVRKAFCYAFNKDKVGREVLRNQYYELGHYGITPPISGVLKGYDFDLVKDAGYEFNPSEARRLLAEAGYPNGEGFGSVTLRYNIDDVHSAMADEFAKQMFMVLGINVNMDGSTFEQLIEDGEMSNGDIFRLGWSADYPNPESFLMNFYGGYVPGDENARSPINKSRYQNPKFDELFKQARNAEKISDQMRLFSEAEVELLKDPPMIPLWYTGDIQITYSRVRNFHFNALNYLDFTEVYKKDWTKEEYQEKHTSK